MFFFQDPKVMLLTIPGILIGFVFHEFAHAWMADRLGDPTPRNQGKLTLDPRTHIDLIGFILIIIVGFGWAKPVQTNPKYFRNPRRDDMLVSFAGPAMNLLIAIFFTVLLKLFFTSNINFGANATISIFNLFVYTIYMNILLFILNLIPFPFFDGYHILVQLVPVWRYQIFALLEQYNTIIFILLAVSGILSRIITPPIGYIFNILFQVFNMPYRI